MFYCSVFFVPAFSDLVDDIRYDAPFVCTYIIISSCSLFFFFFTNRAYVLYFNKIRKLHACLLCLVVSCCACIFVLRS